MNLDNYKCDIAVTIYNFVEESEKLETEFKRIIDNMIDDGYSEEDILKTFGLFGDVTIKDRSKYDKN